MEEVTDTDSSDCQTQYGILNVPTSPPSSEHLSKDTDEIREGGTKKSKSTHRSRRPECQKAYEKLLYECQNFTYDDLEDSQLGITTWTADEKDVFFRALALHGRSHVKDIAAAIGSKSEVEVSAYCKLLEESLRNIYLDGDPEGWLLDPQDMPMAHEMSQQFCQATEEAALALKDSQKEQALDQTPLPELLVVERFPPLSKDLFMNSTRSGYDWRTYSSDQPPSLAAPACTDLSTHIIDHTRRLISTAMFLASSRIRASTRHDRRLQSLVRPDDVESATRILGLDVSSQEFWVDIARRNGLDVYNDLSQDNENRQILQLRDVERRLQRPGNLRTIINDIASDSAESKLSISSDEDDDRASQMSPLLPVSSTDTLSLDRDSTRQTEGWKEESDPMDAYLDHLDMLTSREEEMRLWRLLGQEPPAHVVDELDQDHSPPECPVEEPLIWNEQRDWRLYTDPTPVWTAHDGLEIHGDAFGRQKP